MTYNENILDDDYPVHPGYAYVVDGEPVLSPIGGTVLQLKRELNAGEIRSCDLVRRSLVEQGQRKQSREVDQAEWKLQLRRMLEETETGETLEES